MEFSSAVKVATIVLWNFIALIVNVIAFVIIYMKANKNRTLKAFFVVQSAMMIWLIGKILKTVSPNVDLRWFFIAFYYFGICLLEVAFLEFSYIYYKEKKMHVTLKLFIYTVSMIQFLVVLTNPIHYKFYNVYGFWGDDFGPLFYVHVVINYIYILIGMVMCSIKFKRQIADKRTYERYLITLAIIVPLIFNFIYITRTLETFFDYLGIQVFDITPIIYTWSILIFVYSAFKYEFFYINPIMKHEIAQNLKNPVLILDLAYNKVYANTQFELQLQAAFDKVIISLKDKEKSIINLGDCYYTFHLNHHKTFGVSKLIVCFTDISSYELGKRAINKENIELADSNRKLDNQIQMLRQTSHVGARNYIARELHDILGHSLVVTIKLLEVSKLYYKLDRERALESMNSAVASIHKGFEGMKSLQDKDSSLLYNTDALEKELRSMLKLVTISGIQSTFYMRGQKKLIDESVYDTLKKVITELVTNTLKHAKATSLLLSITVSDTNLMVQTMDNGRGKKHLIKGNGLIGIDGRLSLVGGKAKYATEDGEGFVANISIPIKDYN